MGITVSVGLDLSRFAFRLSTLAARAQRAIVEGLNEGGDKERTQVRRDLKEQTGVKRAGTITSRTKSLRAHPGALRYEIQGEGAGLPIKEFPVSAGVHRPVTARPWGVEHTFKRSFKTSGQGLLRARTSEARLPIRSLRGPSVAKEIVKDHTAEHFESAAPRIVEQMVVKRLGRLMG